MNSYSDFQRIILTTLLAAVVSLTAMAQSAPEKGQGCCQTKSNAGQQHQHGQKQNDENAPGMMQGKMQGGMRGAEQQQDMQTIHALFDNHQQVTRTVRKLDNGVETLTESDDPKVQAMIKEHITAMYKRLENKQPIRMWDPLYAELFKQADKLRMQLITTPKGMKVIETSDDPWVVKLIQAHADGVSEFAREGATVMHKRHELPDTKAEPAAKFLGKGDGITTCPVTGEPVNKNVSAAINGRTVYFCCESCAAAVRKNPELYLKPLNSADNKNAQTMQCCISKKHDR